MPSRRSLLVGCGVVLTGSMSGCIGLLGGGSGSGSEPEPEEDLTADEDATVVAFAEGISGWVRTVSHNPAESVAMVEGAIDVEQERDYRIRLGIVDENGVVLEDTVTTETLYNVGTNTITAEFDGVGDCVSCHSGLLHVDYRDGESYNDGVDGGEGADGDGDRGGNNDSDENSDSDSESESDDDSSSDEESEGGSLGSLGSDENGGGD